MRRHLTYANVTATLALIFAMSGGAFAAKHYLVGSTSQINPKVLKSFAATDAAIFRQMAKTVTVAKAQSAATATTADSAKTASSAATATSALSAASATSADTAKNALALDGLDASSFTHSDCDSRTGQIKGFVTVPGSSTFSGSFVALEGYNCSGQQIEARRVSNGFYRVRFVGNPAGIAVTTINSSGPGGAEDPPPAIASVHSLAAGEWVVHLYEPDPGTQPDYTFEMLLP